MTNNTNKLLCESTSKPSSWLSLSLPPQAYGMPALRKILLRQHAALRAALDSLAILSHTLGANTRLYTAIACMLVLAPLTSVSYMLLNPQVVVAGWYYTSYYYLFYVLCPWISLIIFSTGLFLLFPHGSRRAWFTAIPIVTAITKICWLCTITSNEEFHQIVPHYFLLPALFLALMWLFLIDWLMGRQYHGIDALTARMDGILMANLPHDQKIKHIRTVWTDLKNFKHKF